MLKLMSWLENLVGATPAALGRLCVETIVTGTVEAERAPAALGRLCVETPNLRNIRTCRRASRPRAAVC